MSSGTIRFRCRLLQQSAADGCYTANPSELCFNCLTSRCRARHRGNRQADANHTCPRTATSRALAGDMPCRERSGEAAGLTGRGLAERIELLRIQGLVSERPAHLLPTSTRSISSPCPSSVLPGENMLPLSRRAMKLSIALPVLPWRMCDSLQQPKQA